MLCRSTDHVIDMVDVAVDVADAIFLVFILAHIWCSIHVGHIVLECAQLLNET